MIRGRSIEGHERMKASASGGSAKSAHQGSVNIRRVAAADVAQIIALDAEMTGVEKADYWYSRFHEFGTRDLRNRFFFVAEADRHIVGYIIGEVRDWEFGQPPCGWVFAIGVRSDCRLTGVASRLLEALCDGLRAAGVTKVRTLLAFDDLLVMSFYRSQGMMAARMITLERNLDTEGAT
jgi:GNAT superfamily N-acetyltransferase